jgi:hypothetical protein
MLAEKKSEPGQGLFTPPLTSNVLTATAQAQPEQLRAKRAAPNTHDDDQGHAPVPESARGFQQIQMGTSSRESSSEETETDDGFLNQPYDGMNDQLNEHGRSDKPTFTSANFQGDGSITLSVPNYSSPPVHLIQIHNVR